MKKSTVSTGDGKSEACPADLLRKKAAGLEKKNPRLMFALRTAWYYLLMMALFLYFMLANLSSAPKFVYTAF